MNPNIRTVTDLTTIPASVVQVGTLTPYGSDVLLLEYSGTAAALDAILVQAGANKDQQKIDLWVWDGTSTAPFNITAWFGKFIKVDRDASAYTGDFNLIESKLFGWEVISTGDGTGTVSGSAIGALNTIPFKPITDFFVDPVVVEGNVSDNLTVLEFYNQQAGSGNGSGSGLENYIEVDKAGFLALVATNALTFPALYKVTDIDNGLFIEALSENTFATSGTLSLFVPSYEASGVNLGQMDAVDIPTIAANDMVIWGDHYWVNDTASPITPTIIDTTTLDGGLTQIVKASGSIYDIVEYPCQIDTDLNIISVTSNTGSHWFISSAIANDGGNGMHIYAQLNDALVTVDNLISTFNHKGTLIASSPFMQDDDIMNNSANMIAISINGTSNNISGNKSSGDGNYNNINLVNSSRFEDNEIAGAVTEVAQIGFIELFYNCQMTGNKCLGLNSVIRGVMAGENCKFNNNIINSNEVTVNLVNCGFSDIDMMQFDEIIGNELNGDDAVVQVLNMFGYSKFNNNTFNGAMNSGSLGSFCQFQLYNSEITDNIFNQDFKYWREITMHNAKLRNATDIQVQNCTFDNIDLDLTGFTADIIGQTIKSGKGWFTITHDCTASPLVVGVPKLYNILPINSYVTSIKAIGTLTDGGGAHLQIGMSVDDNALLSHVISNYADGETFSGFSTKATANRSLQLEALNSNITGGSVTVLVEFMV